MLLYEFKITPFKSNLSGYFLMAILVISYGAIQLYPPSQDISIGLAGIVAGALLLIVYSLRPLRNFFLHNIVTDEVAEAKK